MLTIQPSQLDLPKMTEQQWRDLLSARATFFKEAKPDDPLPGPQAQRRFLAATPNLQDEVVFWLLYAADKTCVGYCSLQHPKPEHPDYDANKHRLYVEPVVLAPYRRQGVGTQLLPLIVNHAKKLGASWLQWDTKLESGLLVSEKLGATEAGRQRTSRLPVAQVDWDLLQRWVDEGQARNPEVELLSFVDLPAPRLIDPFCELVTAVNRLQPRADLEGVQFALTPEELEKAAERLAEQNMERLVFCTRGTSAGLTGMFYSKVKPSHAKVRLTGVKREHQGRGLGKWLKAAMMLSLRDRYPSVAFVDTKNFDSNYPMLSVNERMGFALFEQYVFYKISVDSLATEVEHRPFL